MKPIQNKSDSFASQFIKYTFVGGISFVLDFSLLIILTEYLHFHYLISAAISFTAGLALNYILSIKWVFTNRTCAKKSLELTIFAIIGIIGLGLNEIFTWCFTGFFLFPYFISKLTSTFFVYFWNFLARKYILFSDNGKTSYAILFIEKQLNLFSKKSKQPITTPSTNKETL